MVEPIGFQAIKHF